jgi:deoxyadenosine/deoxycytidine kinase
MAQWAFPLQIYFLNSRFQQVLNIRESKVPIIQDRTIYEDAYIFAKNLYDSGKLTERDYQTYLGLFHSMTRMLQPPDLLIYLRATIPTLIEQIAKRGREYEASISLRYLEDLNQHYEQWIGSYTEGKLLVLDADRLDYVHNPEDLGTVINRIDAEFFGLFRATKRWAISD